MCPAPAITTLAVGTSNASSPITAEKKLGLSLPEVNSSGTVVAARAAASTDPDAGSRASSRNVGALASRIARNGSGWRFDDPGPSATWSTNWRRPGGRPIRSARSRGRAPGRTLPARRRCRGRMILRAVPPRAARGRRHWRPVPVAWSPASTSRSPGRGVSGHVHRSAAEVFDQGGQVGGVLGAGPPGPGPDSLREWPRRSQVTTSYRPASTPTTGAQPEPSVHDPCVNTNRGPAPMVS